MATAMTTATMTAGAVVVSAPRSRAPGATAVRAMASPAGRIRVSVGAPSFTPPLLAKGAMSRRVERMTVVRASSSDEEESQDIQYNKQFGYSRKDVILIGVGLTGFGFGGYWALQEFLGFDYVQAGNFMQLLVFGGLCIGWVGSYLVRVKNKDMTYVKQLNDYEEAVMLKRLEEMPEAEVQKMLDEVEAEKAEGVTRTRE